MDHAVVLSPGRTGSHLIRQNLLKYFASVEHTHHPIYKPQNQDTIGVISYRKNEFAAMLSQMLCSGTNEWVHYSTQEIKPFRIDVESFKNYYIHYHMFYKFIKTEYYIKLISVYYEDLIENPKYLFSLFNIDAVTDYTTTKKSPRKYTDFIINIDELKELHGILEKDKESILTENLKTFRYIE